jgi:hypothetical protein
MDLKSVWERMAGGTGEAKAEPTPDYRKDPRYHEAQKRSMSYYGKHGESRPLKDFIEDPDLK